MPAPNDDYLPSLNAREWGNRAFHIATSSLSDEVKAARLRRLNADQMAKRLDSLPGNHTRRARLTIANLTR